MAKEALMRGNSLALESLRSAVGPGASLLLYTRTTERGFVRDPLTAPGSLQPKLRRKTVPIVRRDIAPVNTSLWFPILEN